VRDVSIPGCRLVSSETLKPGDAIRLKFQLPENDRSISVQLAAVKWVRGNEFGVEFILMDADDQERLGKLVRSCTNPESEKPLEIEEICIWA
jgi:hypothetical protein